MEAASAVIFAIFMILLISLISALCSVFHAKAMLYRAQALELAKDFSTERMKALGIKL